MILLLAAHFSRAGNDILAGLVLLVPFLFFIRQRWVIVGMEWIAYAASLAWLYSAYQYIQIRIATGDDWLRLLIIMASVAFYTFWSGIFLRNEKMMLRYGGESQEKE